jgi:hypothetical protein
MILATKGKVVSIRSIIGADFIQEATVDCGEAGIWTGVIQKTINLLDDVAVFLPDAILPAIQRFAFMEKHSYRIKLCRFKGSPSECLIIPLESIEESLKFIGEDLTGFYRVAKYEKSIENTDDFIAGFPHFISKTSELNYQMFPRWVEKLEEPYYVTVKEDGTSSTAFKEDGKLTICSRTLTVKPDADNFYTQLAKKFNLEKLIPDGFGIQYEIIGPGIHDNQSGLREKSIKIFTLLKKAEGRRNVWEKQPLSELLRFSEETSLPLVDFVYVPKPESVDDLRDIADNVRYKNGKQAEGVVFRAKDQSWSFKVISLNFKG